MIKKILILFIFCVQVHSIAQDMNEYQYFISPINITWRTDELPSEIQNSNVFKDWTNRIYGEIPPIKWCYAHITNKKQQEIIIQEQVGGSGGLSTIVLKKSGGKWNKLVEIFGGFMFFNTPSASNTLIIFERSGADYQNIEYKLIDGRYKQISKREIPYEVSQRNSQDDMYYFFWFMTKGKQRK
jgi:hypothetical protein